MVDLPGTVSFSSKVIQDQDVVNKIDEERYPGNMCTKQEDRLLLSDNISPSVAQNRFISLSGFLHVAGKCRESLQLFTHCTSIGTTDRDVHGLLIQLASSFLVFPENLFNSQLNPIEVLVHRPLQQETGFPNARLTVYSQETKLPLQ